MISAFKKNQAALQGGKVYIEVKNVKDVSYTN